MPVHEVLQNGAHLGYRWGESGKLYRSQEAAERQARAIFAAGWREDADVRAARRQVAQALRPNRLAEAKYARDVVALMRGMHAGILGLVDREILPPLETRHDAIDDLGDRARRVLTSRLREKVAAHVRARAEPMIEVMQAAVDKKNRRAMTLIGIPIAETVSGLAAGYLRGAAGVPATLAEMRENNLRLLEDAGRSYVDQVRSVLTAPENQGARVEVLRDKILARGGVSESRARLIAVDQTLKLCSNITRARQTAAGVTHYRWSTSRDERVRGAPGGKYPDAIPSHYALEGQVFGWNDPPPANVDGSPANPGEAINCRCVPIPILEDADGEEGGGGTQLGLGSVALRALALGIGMWGHARSRGVVEPDPDVDGEDED